MRRKKRKPAARISVGQTLAHRGISIQSYRSRFCRLGTLKGFFGIS